MLTVCWHVKKARQQAVYAVWFQCWIYTGALSGGCTLHMCVSWPTHGQIKWGPNRCAWSGFDSLVLLSTPASFVSWWEKGVVEDLSARWLERPRKSFLGKRENREWETLSTRINTLETLRKAHRRFRCMGQKENLLHRLQTFPRAKKILEKSTLLSNVLEIGIV